MGVGGVVGLCELMPVQHDDGIGGEDPRMRVARGNIRRFEFRQTHGLDVRRKGVVEGFIDGTGNHIELKSTHGEQMVPPRRGGCEDESGHGSEDRGSLCIFDKPLTTLCHVPPAPRSNLLH